MNQLRHYSNNKKFNKIATAVMVGMLSSHSSSLLAQESAPDDIESITVTGVRGSLLKSLNSKRLSNKLIDVITAEDIGKFPEANLSEALQRVPGVTLNRNATGEGTAINLRGLGPEFTSTEVNGMLAGGNGGKRGFSFEIFPAELFNNVEISKSVTADQVEGGIAGNVALNTPDPLSTDEPVLNVSLYNNYSENTGTNSPKASIVFNRNWDDTFGINAALVYADLDMQYNAIGGTSHTPLSAVWKGPAVGEPGGATQEQLDAVYPRIESFEHTTESRETLGGVVTAQWRPNNTLDVKARALIGTIDADNRRTILDAPSESNITAVSNTVIQNGVATQATLTGVQQRIGARQSLVDEEVNQFTLSADWEISDSLMFSPYIGHFSREKTDSNDLFSFRRMGIDGAFVPADVSYIIRDDLLEWSTPDTDYASNPEEFVLNVFIRRPTETKDSNTSVKFDFQYDDSDLLTVDFGMRLTSRDLDQISERTNLFVDRGNPLNRRTDLPTLADVFTPLENFKIDGAGFAPATLIGADAELIKSIFYGANGSSVPEGTSIVPTASHALLNTFELQEDTLALFAQANIEVSDDLNISTGLRFVRTDQTIGTQSTTNRNDPSAYTPITLKSDYQEVLPNINIRYQHSDEVVIRSTYFKSLTRPALSELAGSENFNGIDEGGGRGSRGNPDLQPFTADNYDLGVEWYFSSEAIASVNLFYKDLDGFIDTSSSVEDREFPRQSDNVFVIGPIIFTQPENGVAATITGLELAYQSRLGFISESLEDFGLLMNYTIIESAAQYLDSGDVRNSGLPGLSESSFNVAVYYDVENFNARMSYTWRDEYLVAFASIAGIPEWQDDYGQLDFSASYDVTDSLQFQVQASNLLSTQQVRRSVLNTPFNLTQIDRRFIAGIRYAF
jgi:iron complex outermembrane receptor protein